MITMMAFRMQDVVLGWQMLEATDSAFLVGLVAFASGLPWLIWSPITGVLADRTKRRQWIVAVALMLASLSSAGLALLTTLGSVLPWHIIVASFLVSSALTLYMPARLALMLNLVPVRMLLSALTVELSSRRLMVFFSPAVAGALVDVVGVPTTLMVQVVLFALAALVFVRTGTEVGCPASVDNRRGSMLDGFREAAAYLRHDQPLLALTLLGLVMVPFGMSYQNLMPVFCPGCPGGRRFDFGIDGGGFKFGCCLGRLRDSCSGRWLPQRTRSVAFVHYVWMCAGGLCLLPTDLVGATTVASAGSSCRCLPDSEYCGLSEPASRHAARTYDECLGDGVGADSFCHSGSGRRRRAVGRDHCLGNERCGLRGVLYWDGVG